MKYIFKLSLILCVALSFVACGSVNTRYAKDSSADTEKIEVSAISYDVYWIETNTSLTSKINNIFFQVTKIKDNIQLAEEHKRDVPKIIDTIQNFIDTSSQLNLSYEEQQLNDLRIEEFRNLKLELENYVIMLDNPNLTKDDMQLAVDTIKSKWDIIKSI